MVVGLILMPLPTSLHAAITQKNSIIILTAKTSNLTLTDDVSFQKMVRGGWFAGNSQLGEGGGGGRNSEKKERVCKTFFDSLFYCKYNLSRGQVKPLIIREISGSYGD
jgi:hypothetical protein